MFARLQKIVMARRADIAMSLIVIVWGTYYIVVKDALNHLAPLTFNAIRFVAGLPVLLIAVTRAPGGIHVARADRPRLILLGLVGSFGFQALMVLALARTTPTNAALLTSTSPMWTALLSLALGTLVLVRPMLIGLALSVTGVSLVVLGRAGTGVSFSSSDLIGSAMALGGAMIGAVYNIRIKRLVDRNGSTAVALWVYLTTTTALLIVSAPDLLTLRPAELPLRVWPAVLYCGVLSSGLGYLIESYAFRALGPVRTSSYSNFTPIVAAVAAFIVLGDVPRPLVITGGTLTVFGVLLVRRNTFLRLPRPAVTPSSPGEALTPVPSPSGRGKQAGW